MDLTTLKFFPAEPMGGLGYLKAIAAPYVGVNFMPTGGINATNVASLPRVRPRRRVRRIVDGAGRLDRREAVRSHSRRVAARVRHRSRSRPGADRQSGSDAHDARRHARRGHAAAQVARRSSGCFSRRRSRQRSAARRRTSRRRSPSSAFDARFVEAIPANNVGDACLASLRALGVDTSMMRRQGERLGVYYLENGANQRPSRVTYDRAGLVDRDGPRRATSIGTRSSTAPTGSTSAASRRRSARRPPSSRSRRRGRRASAGSPCRATTTIARICGSTARARRR